MHSRLKLQALQNAPLLLLVAVFLTFGTRARAFLHPANLVNILVQSSSAGIVATGMTFVLLTAGIDLSVGSVMFVSAALAGKIALSGAPLSLALPAVLLTGTVCGAVNSFFITRLKLMPFIVTLATLYVGRGLGLWITETRAMNLPESLLQLGTARVLAVPLPVAVFACVLLAGHLVLSRTPFGRFIYAIGKDRDAAEKAGINTTGVIAAVYVMSGAVAALGGLVSVAQLGAVSPTFGNQREFAAIAAAVLGGTSLFGGRGNVFPGTVLGAVLIQTVENGLVIVNADPYLYPLVMSAIIFAAVLIDSFRNQQARRAGRRYIRAGARSQGGTA